MRTGSDYIVIDLEINNPGSDHETIIELGAVKFLRDGGIHPETFTALIKHGGHIQPEIVQLTGITDEEMARDGKVFPTVMAAFERWAHQGGKNVLLAAWGGDVNELHDACKTAGIDFPFRRKNLEIKSVMMIMSAFLGVKTASDGLKTIMKAWQVSWDSAFGAPHRALADAFNTARLLRAVWEAKDNIENRFLNLGLKIGVRP